MRLAGCYILAIVIFIAYLILSWIGLIEQIDQLTPYRHWLVALILAAVTFLTCRIVDCSQGHFDSHCPDIRDTSTKENILTD